MSTKTKIIITVLAIGFLFLVAVVFSQPEQQYNENGMPINNDGAPVEQVQ